MRRRFWKRIIQNNYLYFVIKVSLILFYYVQAVLEEHKSEGRQISENSPNHLVLDTNCFIDYLHHIKKLLDSKSFTLVVPLIGKKHICDLVVDTVLFLRGYS